MPDVDDGERVMAKLESTASCRAEPRDRCEPGHVLQRRTSISLSWSGSLLIPPNEVTSTEQNAESNQPSNGTQPNPPLPRPPDMAELLATQTRFMPVMTDVVLSQNQNCFHVHEHEPQPESLAKKVESFIKLKAPTFDYSDDLLEADNWLREIEKKLDLLNCSDEECVVLASHQLIGTARAWWDSYRDTHADPANISWGEFVSAFCEFHIPKQLMIHKAGEFFSMKQRTMRVQEYASHFTRMMRYAPNETSTDEKRQYWFKRGLQRRLRIHLASKDYQSLRHLIDKAIAVEKERLDYKESVLAKRKHTELSHPDPSRKPVAKPSHLEKITVRSRPCQSGRLVMKARNQEVSYQAQEERAWDPTFTQAPTRGNSNVLICFFCGEPGHKATKCLKKKHQGHARTD